MSEEKDWHAELLARAKRGDVVTGLELLQYPELGAMLRRLEAEGVIVQRHHVDRDAVTLALTEG